MSARYRLRLVIGYTVVSALAALIVFVILSRRPAGRPVQLQPLPTPAPLRVHVTGAVVAPGVYLLPPGSIVKDAVEAAGGATAEADLEKLNLARLLKDGDQVLVLAEGEAATTSPLASETSAPAAVVIDQPINLNTATAAELETLPGIGPALAQRIIDYRGAHGPFAAVEDLLQVSGIGPAKVDSIRSLVTVN